MQIRSFATSTVVAIAVAATGAVSQSQQSADLPRPGFHHIHMNSPNPAAAIDQYMKVYPASTKVSVSGYEGIRSANGITLLFTKVNAPPPADRKSVV